MATSTKTLLFDVQLAPGWNLISFPKNPEPHAIDEAIPATHPASQVLTYAPRFGAGPWLAATRGANGRWTGTLTAVTAAQAYWVLTDSYATLEVRCSSQAPGIIALDLGWNLVPVVVKDPAVWGERISADNYFRGVTWTVAYSYDPSTKRWLKLMPRVNSFVEVGKGYWVWVTRIGQLHPGRTT